MRLRKDIRVVVLAAIFGVLGIVAPASADAFLLDSFRLPPSDVPAPGVDSNYKWGAPVYGTPGDTVSYSYIPGGTACGILNPTTVGVPTCVVTDPLSSFLPVGYQAAFGAAFGQWSTYGDIEFANVADGGAAVNGGGAGFSGNIRIGGYNMGHVSTLAFAFFPYPADTVDSALGDVFFNSYYGWELVSDGTGDGAFNMALVALHELGHSLGLAHEPSGEAAAIMNPFYSEAFSTLRPDDIAGVQFIYGPQQETTIPEPTTVLLVGSGVCHFVRSRSKRRSQ